MSHFPWSGKPLHHWTAMSSSSHLHNIFYRENLIFNIIGDFHSFDVTKQQQITQRPHEKELVPECC